MRPIHQICTVRSMALLITILIPLPLGLLVRNRTSAYLAYVAVHGFVFTFQTAALILEWANGSTEAFGPFPEFENENLWAYGIINLAIYAIGFGLVSLGGRIRSKRSSRRDAVELTPQLH